MTTCPKCDYTRQPSDTAPDYECPKCGVIYHKYIEAQRARMAGEPAQPAKPAQTTRPASIPVQEPPDPDDDIEEFAARLRLDSRYPTFRELVNVIYYGWLVLAALMFIGGVAALVATGGIAGVGGLIVGLFFAVLFVVIARISRELSLMLVDLSDAAVRIASRVRP